MMGERCLAVVCEDQHLSKRYMQKALCQFLMLSSFTPQLPV
jgi:hypothetical protein